MRPHLHCFVDNYNEQATHFCEFNTKTVQRKRALQVAVFVHILSLFACSTASGSLDPHSSQISTPCLAGSTIPHVARNTSAQCFLWSNHTSQEMCALSPEDRIQRFRSTFLFADLQPISLHAVFSAGSSSDIWSRRLLSGVRGSDCVRETGALCRACFDRLATALRRLDDAYRSFDQTLFRFDCMPAVDTASATRPFSPNGSCTTCRVIMVQALVARADHISIWREPPCVNWCYYAQLACPHLATSKVVDYAGHPSFQCRVSKCNSLDVRSGIPLPQEPEAQRCGCVHPCDLRGVVEDGNMMRTHIVAHDFYPSRLHCEARRRHCARTTAHDRREQRVASYTGDGSSFVRHLFITVVLAVAVIN
ncbi:hypothetical protein OSTOST_04770 [Ostertagia ostertagi]